MSDEMKTAVLGPLPEPFMELHREISPHVYAAWAEQMRAYAAEQVAAERERWESAIGALMPADFKQWRDSPVERPATAAWCIANAREQADQAWAQLKSAARWMRAIDERDAALAVKDAEIERLRADVANLRDALRWYAEGSHFMMAVQDAWDTVSGEPQNWWGDEAGTAMVEDGRHAKLVLAGELTGAQLHAPED